MSLLRQRAELRGLSDQGHAVEVVPPEGLLGDPAGETAQTDSVVALKAAR